MGILRFGINKELVQWLADTSKIDTFIETGTNRAETTVWASEHFKQVYTIEAFKPLFEAAQQKYSRISNIKFLHGDTCLHLPAIVGQLQQPALIWLDAHWCGEHTHGIEAECPVAAELAAINASQIPHIIMIDDARLFLEPPPLPHNATHWPSIGEVCELLSHSSVSRHIVVHEDVVYAVPQDMRVKFTHRLQSESTAVPVNGSSGSTPQSTLKKMINRILRPAGVRVVSDWETLS